MSEQATKKVEKDEVFVSHLEGYIERNDRAALAHLRRGLGKEPGTAMEIFPYIPWWITNKYNEDAYFLIASLVGLYPTRSKGDRFNNLGKSLSRIKDASDSIEKRFTALLNANEEDLSDHLRQIIGLLKSNDVPINWLVLLKDIKKWSHEKKFVQKNWARGFWGNRDSNEQKGDENK